MAGIIQRIRTRAHNARQECAQGLVEFALVLPVMLLMLFALVDFGRGFYTWLLVTNAAREGARVAATQKNYNTVQTRIYDSIGALNPGDLDITPTNIQGVRGEAVEIDLVYEFEFVTPIGEIMNFISGGTLDTPTISSHASMRLE